MNYNYPGSIAEHNMNFASTVDVVVDEKNELFNAISIYIPLSLAGDNIKDFDPAWVTVEKPAVITCTVDSYAKYMKGQLLNQWQDVFIQDTNVDVILYLIVFADGASTDTLWEYDDVSISFTPITEAFNKLYFISYFKTMFDNTYDGKSSDVITTQSIPAAAEIEFVNTNTNDPVVLSEGTYTWNDGAKTWNLVVASDITVPVEESVTLVANATTAGDDALLQIGIITINNVSSEFIINVVSVAQGTNSVVTNIPSKYFDYALALANMCKQDLKLSYFVSMVKINYVDGKPDTNNLCWIRNATSAEEKEMMTSIRTGDRAKYYWGSLLLSGCTKNAWTLVHSEPVNIIPLILAGWFGGGRNSSEQYVGNKLSMLRLRGVKIKPCGFPSLLNNEINQNDKDGIEVLQAKNVGFLRTIADNTPQESCVDNARSIDGTPVNAMMISKWVDYTCAQQCAKFITDDGTVTDPVLTNADAYKRIQAIVHNNLLLFTGTKRVSGIELKFPAFSVAKVGPRELRAARSWKAYYSDDLEKITITGGIVG